MNKDHQKIYFRIAFTVALVIGSLTMIPATREYFRSFLVTDQRTILAKAEGDISGKDDRVIVIKVKTNETLSLEVYSTATPESEMTFQKRIVLPEKRDGYFTFQGHDTNLVLADIDGDGAMEIIAPTFDENLFPRLNIYKYDLTNQSFQRMGSDSIKL